jgi:hypothetical protein
MEKGKKQKPYSYQGALVRFDGSKVQFKTNDGKLLEYSADAWTIEIAFDSLGSIYQRNGANNPFSTNPVQPGRIASSFGSDTTKDTDLQQAHLQQPSTPTPAPETQPVDLTQCHGRGVNSDSIAVIVGNSNAPIQGLLKTVQNGVITFQQAQQKSTQIFRETLEVSSILIGSCN